MSRQKFKKTLIVILLGIFISSSVIYFLYETERIWKNESFSKPKVKEVNLDYMNKAIDGYEGEIDHQEFIGRFISWSFLNLYSEDLFNENIEFAFSFEGNHVYTKIEINQELYQIYDFLEREN